MARSKRSAARVAALRRLVAEDEALSLDACSLLVTDAVTGKQLDGRNIVHLQRFLAGKSRRAFIQAHASRTQPCMRTCALWEKVDLACVEVPAVIANRVLRISASLMLHYRIEHLMGVYLNSVGAAVASISATLSGDEFVKAKAIVIDGNYARHAPFVPATSSPMDSAPAAVPAPALEPKYSD